MSVSILSLSRGTSTIRIMRRELCRIEQATGICPEDWMQEEHDQTVEECRRQDGFDWEEFEMHMACTADNFIEFWNDHYQHLNNDL